MHWLALDGAKPIDAEFEHDQESLSIYKDSSGPEHLHETDIIGVIYDP